MRKILPHAPPPWIDPERESFFLTINCKLRWANQLALPDLAPRLFSTVDHRQRQWVWWCDLMLLMPDHLHALMSFPRHHLPFQRRLEKWKEWTAKTLGIRWQRGVFDHRLRGDAMREQKARYILENPIRRGLAHRMEQWPFVWFADGPRPYGWPGRLADRSATG